MKARHFDVMFPHDLKLEEIKDFVHVLFEIQRNFRSGRFICFADTFSPKNAENAENQIRLHCYKMASVEKA